MAIVGFSGARSGVSASLVQRVVQSVLAGEKQVAVGCSSGVDQVVIQAVLSQGQAGRLSVYAAFGRHQSGQVYGQWRGSAVAAVVAASVAGAQVQWRAGWSSSKSGSVPARLAARSTALVKAVKGGGRGSALVGFPGGACPRSVKPARSWPGGSGSGTWASLGLAAGLGVPVLVFPPAGVSLPSHWGGEWVRVSSQPSSVWYQAWRWRSGQVVAACGSFSSGPLVVYGSTSRGS